MNRKTEFKINVHAEILNEMKLFIIHFKIDIATSHRNGKIN